MTKLLLPSLLGAVGLSTTASAQMLLGIAYSGESYHINLTNGAVTTPVSVGEPAVGMAADDANGIIYTSQVNAMNAGDLYMTDYADPTSQVMLGLVTDTASGFPLRLEGMAFGNGKLYALHEFDTTTMAPEGIYEIDIPNLTAAPIYLFPDTSIDCGGLGYDPINDKFYATNDAAAYPAGAGLVEIDPVAQTETLLTAYPAGRVDIDGCTVDPVNGIVYLLEDEPAPLHAYNLGTASYDPAPMMSPYAGAGQTFSSGAWAPGYGMGGPIGSLYCNPAIMNSTGSAGTMSAIGSTVAADNDVTLTASSLPANQFGIFVTSMTQAFVPGAGGTSNGDLCLGGSLGRYSAAGQILSSGGNGEFSLALDLTQTPQGAGFVTVMSGETWNFQAWYRDGVGVGSNFTDGLEISFQ